MTVAANTPPGIGNHALYYQPDPRAPMTRLSLVFHGAGTQQETEEKAGVARLAAKTLFRATPLMDRETIARRLELLGADVNAHATETDFTVSISCFTRTLDETLELVHTILREASFPQNEIELVKKQELNHLIATLQEPERVLSAAHHYVLYEGRRFGKIGSRRALEEISRSDVGEYFDAVRRTAVLYATAISDLPRDEVMQKLRRFTDGRRSDGFALKPEAAFRDAHGREAVVFESPDASNDRLLWSHRGIVAADDRWFDLSLVIDALGSFEGFLFDVLRNKNGWCYGAYAFLTPGTLRPGRVSYYSDPSSETSMKLIPELLRLMRGFPREEDFRARLAERNTTFKNRYAYQLDPAFMLASEVNRDRYGVPILDREAYHRRIDAVTQGTAASVIENVFDRENLVMVFYGVPQRIEGILGTVDPSISVNIRDRTLLIE